MFGVEPKSLIIILVIILVLFGPKKLPELAKAIGKSMRELKDGMSGVKDEFDKAMTDDEKEEEPKAQKTIPETQPRDDQQSAAPTVGEEQPHQTN